MSSYETTDELHRYDNTCAVVVGCASGIGACVAGQLLELGAEVIGLDIEPPEHLRDNAFRRVNLADVESIDHAVASIDRRIDSLFNVAGVSSGIGDPLKVVTVNFLGTRHLTESLIPKMTPGSSIACVSSLAAAAYRDNHRQTMPLVRTTSMAEGISWCTDHPEALSDGGYRLSKEALILYSLINAAPLAQEGIRINCVAPGVTDTPILTHYDAAYLQQFRPPLGRFATATEQAAILTFLNSKAAAYLTGQVLWADGGIHANTLAAEMQWTNAETPTPTT
ncbi:SDR family NAD(P)-dependent oxidoreductase [Mycolicibacterium moriokaense]|nr:SDR family NAD(P)-dependent oxidoreductase [Mycolicibacterium moriokaense]